MTNNNQSQNVRAAMSIDLGSEFLKLALVKHGVPMEIVLNRESHRKTPFALTLRQGERFFGSEALKKGVSATRQTYTFFLDIIGKVYNDPSVEDYRQRFPHMQITQNEHRGGVNFMTDSGEIPAETLLAMVLAHARAEVEAYATQPVKDVVIAVPLFFGNSERKAVKTAAQIAGLNLLQLLSSGAAAGLNYGVFRYKDITEQPQTLLIYDVGSTSVQATVVQYLLATIEEEGKEPSTIPKMEIIGVGFDPNVGGHRLTLKLRDFLVEAFRQQHPKTESDISTSPQAMTKLLREADRVKQVLSANLETFAHVECLFQDLDFRAKVTRTDLEDMFKEFEQAFLTPIKFALEQAKVQVEILDRILLMGAGTRVPRLQEILSQYFGSKQLSHNLNTDEAIALGAIYQAARESKNFIVKRFDVVDYMLESVEGQQGVKPMDEKEIAQAKALLFEFETREKAKVARDAALNSLESAVFDYSAKMEEDEFTKFGTNEELEFINNSLARMKEWLDEVPDDIDAEKLKEKRRDLVKPIRKLKNRKRQKEERPEYIVKLNKVLDDAEKQLLTFRASENIFAETDLDAFNQLINNTKGWFQSIKKELEGLADNQDATFSPDDIKAKTTALNRELKLLSNKLKAAPTPKPPTKEGPAVEVAPNANNKDANEKGETAASEMDVENGGEKAPGPERMKREGHEHDDETLMLKNNGGMSDGVKVTKMEVDNQ